MQLPPHSLAVNDHAPFIENLKQGQRVVQHLPQARDVNLATEFLAEAHRQPHPVEHLVAVEVDDEIDIGKPVVIAAGHRAGEDGYSDTWLGPQRTPQFGEKLPVAAKVVKLTAHQSQSSLTQSSGSNRPKGDSAAKSSFRSVKLI